MLYSKKLAAVKESGDKTNRYFTINTPERVYCLKATDERDMLRWVYGLNEVLRRIAKVTICALIVVSKLRERIVFHLG